MRVGGPVPLATSSASRGEAPQRLGGDVARLTNRLTDATTKVYVFVVVLPFSNRLWDEGFCDMR